MDETRTCINLVMTVKKYPALYDLSCNDYHNRVVRNKMWKAVAQEVNTSAAACKEKWKNLRASFSRHLRNQCAAGAKSKKPYYMADYMDFLLPYSKPRRREENSNEIPAHQNWVEDESVSDTSSTKSYEKPSKSSQTASDADKEADSKNRIKMKLNDVDALHRCTINCIGNNRPEIDEMFNDGDFLFFKSLLPDVRQMTRHEKYNFRISVLSLIDKILSESRPEILENVPSVAIGDPENENGI